MKYAVAIIIFISLLYGGTKLEGWVYDADTKKPVPYASVAILKTELGTACNDKGYFVIIDVPPGRYDIEVSCIGYQTLIKQGVVVRGGHPLEMRFKLRSSPISVKPIVSTAREPELTKEMVGTTIVVRFDEPRFTPTTYPLEKIMFQPAVAYTGTTYHVRGGRAEEVLYLVDDVPIVDPQNGDMGLYFHQGMVEEAIFFPGTFGVEYGRALSGVLSIISPPVTGANLKAKTISEKPVTEFGFFNLQPTLTVSPILLTSDLTTTDDWDPRLVLRSHKQRQDYCFYGKSKVRIKKNLKLDLSGARSRTQFDRYHPDWRYHLNNYRSDLRIGNLITSNLSFLPRSNIFFDLILSYFDMTKEYGVREFGSMLPYESIRFMNYRGYQQPIKGADNPTGWDKFFFTEGDYPEYSRSRSDQWFGKFISKIQLTPKHEIYFGLNGYYFDINKFNIIYPYATMPIIDDYQYNPREFGAFIEDGIEYYDLFIKLGTRVDRYYNDLGNIVTAVSPRIGFSFMINENLLMRSNIGRYVQPPLFDQIYSLQGYQTRTLPDGSPILIGNPDLKPEKTISTEIGFQGRLAEGINATTTFFYKDVGDLIGTQLIPSLPEDYFTYMNVEYANIKGLEFVFSFYRPFIDGHISYTLSYARGTSSYATEGYWEYIAEHAESILHYPKSDYPLDFDQRHRIFVRTTFHLPHNFDLFTYLYLGSGFPYTPPGGKGDPLTMNVYKGPFRKDLGISLSRAFNMGRSKFNIFLEILNVLDVRDIRYVYSATGEPDDNGVVVDREDFMGGLTLFDRGYYHPGQDMDHDGFVTAREAYLSYVRANYTSMDWPNNYGPARRCRFGMSFEF